MARHDTARLAALTLAFGALAVAAGPLAGCRGQRTDKTPHQFLPDMDDSPKWKPQSQSEFFADGRTMRQPVEGTVAFGWHSEAAHLGGGMPVDFARRADFLKDDRAFYFGRDAEGEFLTVMPRSMTVTRDLLLRGQERFNIYCAACHGYEGEGGYADGTQPVNSSAMVGKRWSIPVPSYHDPKYQDPAQRTGKDGYLFDVARYGVWDDPVNHTGNQRMPGYAHAVDAHDAWAIVAYIRVLQAMRTTDVQSIPPAQRPSDGERPPPREPEAAPATTGTQPRPAPAPTANAGENAQ